MLESPTWRANPDWARRLGYSLERLDELNRKAIALLEELRAEYKGEQPIVISGCIGPQGDGYAPDSMLTPDEAEAYHAVQIGTFADTTADMVTAITMTYAEEAIGVARAAEAVGLPNVISFTLETDGRLPSGQTLSAAIEQVDEATRNAPAYYMLNCAIRRTSRTCLSPARRGPSESAGSARTRRPRATRSWTRPNSWTKEIRQTWPSDMRRCGRSCPA